METTLTSTEEWTAAPLRPVARWVRHVDDTGRARLEMEWHVPDLDEVLGRPLSANA